MSFAPNVWKKFGAPVLLAVAGLATASVASALEVGEPVLITRSAFGGAPAPGTSSGPALTTNGRYLVFHSFRPDIVSDDDNFVGDVFWMDLQTGVIERVSVDSDGESSFPSEIGSQAGIGSDDGRYVIFNSYLPLHSDAFVGSPSRVFSNTYLRDRISGQTHLLSRDTDGRVRAGETRFLGGVDFERKWFTFSGRENYLGGPDENSQAVSDLYLRNWESGEIWNVTESTNGGQSSASPGPAIIARDGRVIFLSSANNITTDNPHGMPLVFDWSRTRGARRVLFPPSGEFEFYPAYGGHVLSVAADSRTLAISLASNEMDAGDNPHAVDGYLLDLVTLDSELVTRSATGVVDAHGFNGQMDISDDGRLVAFFTLSPNMAVPPGPTPAVYLRDRLTGETINVTAPLGAATGGFIGDISLSGDGTRLAISWSTSVGNPSPEDDSQIWVFDIDRGVDPLPPAPVPAGRPLMWVVLMALFVGVAFTRVRADVRKSVRRR